MMRFLVWLLSSHQSLLSLILLFISHPLLCCFSSFIISLSLSLSFSLWNRNNFNVLSMIRKSWNATCLTHCTVLCIMSDFHYTKLPWTWRELLHIIPNYDFNIDLQLMDENMVQWLYIFRVVFQFCSYVVLDSES